MILKGKQIRGTINVKIGFIKRTIVFKVASFVGNPVFSCSPLRHYKKYSSFVFRIENVLEGFFDYSSQFLIIRLGRKFFLCLSMVLSGGSAFLIYLGNHLNFYSTLNCRFFFMKSHFLQLSKQGFLSFQYSPFREERTELYT